MATMALNSPTPMHSGSEERRRDRHCGDKVSFQSQMLADNAAILHEWDGRPGMTGYKCSFCPDYHVGHPPGSGVKPKREWRPWRSRRFGAKDAT